MALRKSIKARDIWDLTWLYQQKVEADPKLVLRKLEDYQSQNGVEVLASRLLALPQYLDSGEFEQEMERFLMASISQTSIHQEGFIDYVKDTVNRQGRKLMAGLDNSINTQFKM